MVIDVCVNDMGAIDDVDVFDNTAIDKDCSASDLLANDVGITDVLATKTSCENDEEIVEKIVSGCDKSTVEAD